MYLAQDLAKRVAEVMNEVHKHDPEAAKDLFIRRWAVSDAFDDHPTIQVYKDKDGQSWLSGLGFLNGVIGADHESIGYLFADFEEVGVELLEGPNRGDYLIGFGHREPGQRLEED